MSDDAETTSTAAVTASVSEADSAIANEHTPSPLPPPPQQQLKEPDAAENLKAEEPKPTEEPKADEPKADEPKADEPKSSEPKLEEHKPEEHKPEEPKPEEPKPEEPKPEEHKPEEPKPEEHKPEEPKPEDHKPEDHKPEEPKAEEPRPEEHKLEEPKPDEPKIDEPKPEVSKAEETKSTEVEEPRPADKPQAVEDKASDEPADSKVEPTQPPDQPKTEEPKADEPKTEESKVEEPPKIESAEAESTKVAATEQTKEQETPSAEKVKGPPPVAKDSKPRSASKDNLANESLEEPSKDGLAAGSSASLPTPVKMPKPTPSSGNTSATLATSGSKISAMGGALKLPIMAPGQAPPGPKDEAEMPSFDRPLTDVRTLDNAAKTRSMFAPKGRRLPTKPMKIYLIDGSYRGVQIMQESTCENVITLMIEKLELEGTKLTDYGIYTVGNDGEEKLHKTDKNVNEVVQDWGERKFDYKLFFKKRSDPMVIKLHPELFEQHLLTGSAPPMLDDGSATPGGSKQASVVEGLSKMAKSTTTESLSAKKQKEEDERQKAEEKKKAEQKKAEEAAAKKEAEQAARQAEQAKKAEEAAAKKEAELAARQAEQAKKAEEAAAKKEAELAARQAEQAKKAEEALKKTEEANKAAAEATRKRITIKGAEVQIAYDDKGIAVQTLQGKPLPKFPAPWSSLIGVSVNPRESQAAAEAGSASASTSTSAGCDVNLYFLQPWRPSKRVVEKITASYGDADNAEQLRAACQQRLDQAGLKLSRRLLVLVNPDAGKKKGAKILSKYVLPILEACQSQKTSTIQSTTSKGHATKIVQEIKVSEYDGILAIGGDGLVHDIVNGLLSRPDWEHAKELPIGVIAAGSTNGLAVSLAGLEDGLDASLSTLAAIKGSTQSLDICSVHSEKRRVFSFAGQKYGLLAQVDLGSEGNSWRKLLGDTPFAIATAAIVGGKRKFPAKLSMFVQVEKEQVLDPSAPVKPKTAPTEAAPVPTPTQTNGDSSGHEASSPVNGADSHIESDDDLMQQIKAALKKENEKNAAAAKTNGNDVPSITVSDESGDPGKGTSEGPSENNEPAEKTEAKANGDDDDSDDDDDETPRPKIDKGKGKLVVEDENKQTPTSNGESGPDVVAAAPRATPTTEAKAATAVEPAQKRTVANLGHGPVLSFGTLAAELPPSWTSVDGEFVSLAAANVAYLSKNAKAAPFTHPSDGLIDLSFVMFNDNTAELQRVFKLMEMGEHVSSNLVQYTKVKAFRLEPRSTTTPSFISIDGETFDFGPLQVEVHPGLLRIFSSHSEGYQIKAAKAK